MNTNYSSKRRWFISRTAQTMLAGFALVGALDLIGASPFTPSTAAIPDQPSVSAADYIVPALPYYPGQFVNHGTRVMEHIESCGCG